MKATRLINCNAFTLVELLIVIAIISILALIALPNFEEAQTRAKVSAVKSNMRVTATKMEMHAVDGNRYPWAGKWRRLIAWRVLSGEEVDPETSFVLRMKPLYGPHWDVFEWEALKQNAMQDEGADDGPLEEPDSDDSDWLVNEQGQHLYNGFGMFSPKTMLSAIEHCYAWEGADWSHWQAIEQSAGGWLLVSTGPDLVAETPKWWGHFCEPNYYVIDRITNEGYNEKNYFTQYDPTNGTVSYGNIFRSQKDPAGLGRNEEETAWIAEPGWGVEPPIPPIPCCFGNYDTVY